MCRLQSRGDTSIISQSVTNNRCAPHVGVQEKSGGTSKKFRQAPAHHLQIASDATETDGHRLPSLRTASCGNDLTHKIPPEIGQLLAHYQCECACRVKPSTCVTNAEWQNVDHGDPVFPPQVELQQRIIPQPRIDGVRVEMSPFDREDDGGVGA